jgi:DME family drug/metabolite transporter
LIGAATAGTVGILLALVSGSTYPMYGYAAKRLMATVTSSVAIATVFAVGGGVLVLLSPGSLGALHRPGHAVVAIAIGVLTVSIAYPLWAHGLRTLDVGTVALITLLEPATAALLGVAIVGEPITTGLVVGSVLVIAGIALSSSTAAARPNPPTPTSDRNDGASTWPRQEIR